MRTQHNTVISHHPEGNWRGYLTKRKSLFELDARGPEARVRFIPNGFDAASNGC
jgi:hypothetical protein